MKKALLVTALATTCVAVPGTANAVASAELYKTQAYGYGRFDARIRFAAGDGVISSFFLWKEGSEAANAFWNELDFEKVGADCHMETNAIYGNPETLHSQTNEMPGDVCSEYHDYRFEWTPTYIAWAVDGKEIRRETGPTADAFSQNATSGMTFHFNVWVGNSDFGGNFSSSILPVREHISWVAYSSYNNGTFKSEWREDFNGSNLPSGWATGTWASPYGLSTHKSSNVTLANGIVTLSLTADNATGFTGSPPADDASTGGTTAGGSANGGTSTGAGGRGDTTSAGGTNSARGGTATQSSGTVSTSAGGSGTRSGATSSASATKGGSVNSLGSGGRSENPSKTSASTDMIDSGGESSGGSEQVQTGGARTATATSEKTKPTARGGNASTGQSPVESTVQAASNAAADSGCGCRLSSGSDDSRSDITVKLIGLIGLLGAARRRRHHWSTLRQNSSA